MTNIIIDNEIHPILSRKQLAEIRDFREVLEREREIKKQHKIIFNWARNGHLNERQFALLMVYFFRNLDIPEPLPK